MPTQSNPEITVLAETNNYSVWTAKDTDDELVYNIELGEVTLHLFHEEWEEFLQLIKALPKK